MSTPNTRHRLIPSAMWAIFIVAVLLYWPGLVNAAITHDADCHGAGGASPLTVSCTLGSLSNGLLVCGITTGNSSPATDFAVTYNSVSLTSATTLVTNGNSQTEIFYLKAPASGTHNVSVTSSIVSDISASCSSFDGIDQTTPIGNTATLANNYSNGNVATVTITLNTNNFLWGMMASTDSAFTFTGGPTLTPGSGQTETAQFQDNANYQTNESNYKSSASNLSWTFSTSSAAAQVTTAAAVEMKSGGGGGGGSTVRHRVVTP